MIGILTYCMEQVKKDKSNDVVTNIEARLVKVELAMAGHLVGCGHACARCRVRLRGSYGVDPKPL